MAGQYLGFGGILLASVAVTFGAGLFLPDAAIAYFGLIPLLLGLYAAWQVWRNGEDDDDTDPRPGRSRPDRRVGRGSRVPRPQRVGQTTTIRVLLGLLRAEAGQVQLMGGDPWRDRVNLHRRLAYVPGGRGLRGLATRRGPSAWRSALRAWSRCHPVVAHNSSRITTFTPFDADRYRVAVAFVTALRWLIVSPMSEAVPTDRHRLRRHTATRALLHEATNRFRGHLG